MIKVTNLPSGEVVVEIEEMPELWHIFGWIGEECVDFKVSRTFKRAQKIAIKMEAKLNKKVGERA